MEITGPYYSRLVERAEQNHLLPNADDWKRQFFRMELYDRRRSVIKDAMAETAESKERLIERARKELCPKSLIDELERIYAKPNTDLRNGHLFHYLVQTDSRTVFDAIVKILMAALYANNRIRSSR